MRGGLPRGVQNSINVLPCIFREWPLKRGWPPKRGASQEGDHCTLKPYVHITNQPPDITLLSEGFSGLTVCDGESHGRLTRQIRDHCAIESLLPPLKNIRVCHGNSHPTRFEVLHNLCHLYFRSRSHIYPFKTFSVCISTKYIKIDTNMPPFAI